MLPNVSSAQQDPWLGRLIGGRYEIVRRLAKGGMGYVYVGKQVQLDRPVAVKLLRADGAHEEETRARFVQEARATSLLVHPNTVRIFDFGVDETGALFLVMELLEGQPLSTLLRPATPLPMGESIRIAQAMLRSLGEAHSKGLVHRDLKPDNVFLAQIDGTPQPLVKVLDFGIAKAFKPDPHVNQLETQAGTVFGTPRYMSPEQAQGKPLDPRSDLYSVGVILFQMLTGKPPYDELDAVVVMARHIRDPIPSLGQFVSHLPLELNQLMIHALAKRREDRFQNAEQFHDALSEFAHQGSRALVQSGSQRPSAPNPYAVGGGVAIGSGLVGSGLVSSAIPVANQLRGSVETQAAATLDDRSLDTEKTSQRPSQPVWQPGVAPSASPPVQLAQVQTPLAPMAMAPMALGSPAGPAASVAPYTAPSNVDVYGAPGSSPYQRQPQGPTVHTNTTRGRRRALLLLLLLFLLTSVALIWWAVMRPETAPAITIVTPVPRVAPPVARASPSFRIDCTPAEAVVYVDGLARGNCPYRLTIAPGTDGALELRASGYEPFSRRFSEFSGDVRVDLRRLRRRPAATPGEDPRSRLEYERFD